MDLNELARLCTDGARWSGELWDYKKERIEFMCNELDKQLKATELSLEIPKRLTGLTNQCLYYEDLMTGREIPFITHDNLCEMQACKEKKELAGQYLKDNMQKALDDNIEQLFAELESAAAELKH